MRGLALCFGAIACCEVSQPYLSCLHHFGAIADARKAIEFPRGVVKCRRLVEQDCLAEWSKALASGASPKGRGFEPHSSHIYWGAGLLPLSADPRCTHVGTAIGEHA